MVVPPPDRESGLEVLVARAPHGLVVLVDPREGVWCLLLGSHAGAWRPIPRA